MSGQQRQLVLVEDVAGTRRDAAPDVEPLNGARRLLAGLDIDALVRRLEEAGPELVAPQCPKLRKCGTYGE